MLLTKQLQIVTLNGDDFVTCFTADEKGQPILLTRMDPSRPPSPALPAVPHFITFNEKYVAFIANEQLVTRDETAEMFPAAFENLTYLVKCVFLCDLLLHFSDNHMFQWSSNLFILSKHVLARKKLACEAALFQKQDFKILKPEKCTFQARFFTSACLNVENCILAIRKCVRLLISLSRKKQRYWRQVRCF